MAIESGAPLAITVRPVAHLSPASSHVAGLGIAVAVMALGLVLPLSVFGMFLSAGLFAAVLAATGTAPVRKALAQHARWRARQARRDTRDRALPPTSCGRGTLVELTNLVDEIEHRDPELAQRFELEALLDRHVALTIAYESALRATRMADRTTLEYMRDTYREDPGANPRRLDLYERRLRCLTQCEATAERLADELAMLADLIRLVAQRVACPEDLIADDTIARQLSELDDDDAACRQLAADLR
jgi:hypothetical protein